MSRRGRHTRCHELLNSRVWWWSFGVLVEDVFGMLVLRKLEAKRMIFCHCRARRAPA